MKVHETEGNRWLRRSIGALGSLLVFFGVERSVLGSSEANGQESAPTTELAALLFLDVGNPECSGVERELEEFARARNLRLELVVKHAPARVEWIEAHEALEAARAAGKFQEMQAALFRNPGARGSRLVRLAGELGLDTGKFEAALDDRTFRPEVLRDLAEARGLGVKTTPVLFVNGTRMDGVDSIRKALRTPLPKPPPAWENLAAESLPVDLRESPSRGPENAPVTIVEFTDFRCGFCRINSRTLSELEAAFPGQIRRVFKHYPLGKEEAAWLPHRASQAAWEQGKFWDLHHSIMGRPLEDAGDLLRRAEQCGLETNQLARRWTEPEIERRVARDVAEGESLNIRATPTTFINGRRIVGRQSLETLKNYVRGAMGLLVATGGDSLVDATKLDPNSTSLGPADGAVYLEAFVDLSAPGSQFLLARLREFSRERPAVRVEFRSFAATNVPAAMLVQESALAAAEQERFWDWCEVLLREPSSPAMERLSELAEKMNLDRGRFAAALRERRHRTQILADTSEAVERGLNSGAVVMNGTVFHGKPTVENLARHMDEHACCGKAADFKRPVSLPGR